MPKPHPSAAVVSRRVEEILRIILDGAEWWDICEYVREKEREPASAWELPTDAKPLSDSQIRRYLGKATARIAESCRASRKMLLRRHLAQRRNLYAKAVNQGDVRAAIAILKDLAELQGLYPAKRTELTGRQGGTMILHVVEEIVVQKLPAAIESIVEEVVTNGDSRSAD